MLVKNKKFVAAFGNRVRDLRILKNLSQEDLANSAEIPINQVGRIERGEINTTLATIKALADALKVNVVELFDF